MDNEVVEIPGALEWLHSEYFAPKAKLRDKASSPEKLAASTCDDGALIERATRANNGGKFRALLAGDWEGQGYPSQSEADTALCSILAFWTRDPAQIDRVFCGSGLMRDKWNEIHYADGRKYGEAVIEKALNLSSEFFARTNSSVVGAKKNHHHTDTDSPTQESIDALISEQSAEVQETARKLISALEYIKQGDTVNENDKMPTDKRIGYGIGIALPKPLGLAICRKWDSEQKILSDSAGYCAVADPNHPRPSTAASIYKIAANNGWNETAIAERTAAETTDPNISPPKPTDAMFYGLVGDVARAAAKDTEVNPVAAGMAFLSYLGANIGRDVYLPVGNTFHHARLFTLHVGRSGRGRKGDALSLPNRIRARIEEVHAGTAGQYHSGGLSSREGLACIIHDGYKQGKEDIPPVDDKRLWVIESEFANVLHQAKRDGNTLSAALRDAWDGVSIRPATKSSRIWATDPHIGIHACITPSELTGLIESRDLSNGFANRFLMIWAEKTGSVPFPKATPKHEVDALANRTALVIRFAKGNYPASHNSREMQLSQEARILYSEVYVKELTGPDTLELITGLLERQAPYALRLAMLFAVTDSTLTIEARHLNAALAWVRYARQSVRFVFASAALVAESEEKAEAARKVLDFLKDKPEGADRTAIINDCFQKHGSIARIDEALRGLLMATPPRIELIQKPREDGRGGRKRQIYKLCGVCGVSEFGLPHGFEPSEFGAEYGAESAEFEEFGHSSGDAGFQTPQTPQPCGVWETHATSQTPLSPQTPHASEEFADTETF